MDSEICAGRILLLMFLAGVDHAFYEFSPFPCGRFDFEMRAGPIHFSNVSCKRRSRILRIVSVFMWALRFISSFVATIRLSLVGLWFIFFSVRFVLFRNSPRKVMRSTLPIVLIILPTLLSESTNPLSQSKRAGATAQPISG